ncbi:MAG: hypothetical protein ABIU11_04285 [Chitinophagaceae bacterium]
MKNLLIIALAGLFILPISAQSYKGSSQYQSLEEKLNEKYCTGSFKSSNGTILNLESENSVSGYFNILTWMQGRVAGFQVYTSRTGVLVPIIRGLVPGIYVDEIPVNVNYLNTISIQDIAMVKIIKTPFLGGFNGAGGAIAIYTFRGEEDNDEDNSK